MSGNTSPSSSQNQIYLGVIRIVLGIVIGAALMCVIYLISIPPRGRAIILLPQPTSSPMYVHIDGQVASPGLYALPPSSRINDAIELAGGATDLADTTDINLAKKMYDGQKIYIPAKGEGTGESFTELKVTDSGIEILTERVNINTATQSELEKLPGIGPTKAGNIIAYREENGAFLVIEDLLKVNGIGEATYEEVKDLITTE